MKRTFTLIIILSVLGCSTLTAQTVIPNGGFESWVNVNQATSWGSISMLGVNNLFQTTDVHSGTYAAMAKTTDTIIFAQPIIVPGVLTLGSIDIVNQIVTGGIVCTDKPDEFRGFFKYNPVGGDTLNIVIFIWESVGGVKDTVATGVFDTTGVVSAYTAFTVVIDWDSGYIGTPDSLNVALTNSGFAPHGNTVAYFDDLSLYFNSTGISVPLGDMMGEPYPNPSSSMISLLTLAGTRLDVYNMTGQLMHTETASTHQYSMNLGYLPKGMYFLRQTNGDNSVVSKFILQ